MDGWLRQMSQVYFQCVPFQGPPQRLIVVNDFLIESGEFGLERSPHSKVYTQLALELFGTSKVTKSDHAVRRKGREVAGQLVCKNSWETAM